MNCLAFDCRSCGLTLAVVFAWCTSAAGSEPVKTGLVSFHREIRPILQQKCAGCHQPAKQRAGLLLISYDDAVKGGDSGPLWVPGKPDQSVLIKSLRGIDGQKLMPEGEPPLSSEQIALVARWIAEGAKDDTPEQFKKTLVVSGPPTYTQPVTITAMAHTPDGTALAVGGYREVLLHRVPVTIDPAAPGAEGSLIGRLVGLSERIETIVFSPDGGTLLVAGGSAGRFGELQFWDWRNRKLVRSVMPSFDTIYGASFSTDGKRVSYGCADNSIRIADASTGKDIKRIDQHQDWVFGTALSLEGKYIVTCSRDRTVKLFETDTGSFIDNITTITPGILGGGLRCLQRRPGKDEYLTAGEDGIPKLYKMLRTSARQIGDDANLIRNYPKLPGRVETVVFSTDGKMIAAGGVGCQVYGTDDAKLIASLQVPTRVFTLSFQRDGKAIAVAGLDGKVRVFGLPDGKLQTEFVPMPIGEAKK
jgi:WD40 repeat protein